MAKVRVAGFSVSLDGFAAGPEQSLANPLGKGGPELFQWYVPTRTFCAMVGKDGGTTGVDDQYAQRSMAGFGAFILGRNMFGPIRGAWPAEAWKGWWGDNPPYHAPTFILIRHTWASASGQELPRKARSARRSVALHCRRSALRRAMQSGDVPGLRCDRLPDPWHRAWPMHQESSCRRWKSGSSTQAPIRI
jgi:dihydrofolate reductase